MDRLLHKSGANFKLEGYNTISTGKTENHSKIILAGGKNGGGTKIKKLVHKGDMEVSGDHEIADFDVGAGGNVMSYGGSAPVVKKTKK